MNIKLIKTLTVVCLVLMSVIALEWIYAERVQKQLLSSVSSPSKTTLPDEMPAINLNAQPEESYVDVVERPLFIAGRKPVAETEQAQTVTTTNTFDWRLSGIYTTKKGLTALLTRTVAKIPDPANLAAAKTSADKYRKVIVEGDIDGWKVASIHPDEVILMQGSTQKKLLLRKPKAKETPQQDGVTPFNSHALRNRAAPPKPAPAPQAEPEPTTTNDVPENDNNTP